MKQTHGVPAILSLVFPGLGQLVKGQVARAIFVWGVILAPWIGYAAGAAASNDPFLTPDRIIIKFVAEPVFGLVVTLPTAIIWVWSIVDAYRSPAA